MEEESELSEQCQQQQQQQSNITTTFVNRISRIAAQQSTSDDDVWWWEVENGDLILDLVPNFDVLQQSENENIIENNSSNNVPSDDFVTLLKHAETAINITNTNDSTSDNAISEEIPQTIEFSDKQLFDKEQLTTTTTTTPTSIDFVDDKSSLANCNCFHNSHDTSAAANTTTTTESTTAHGNAATAAVREQTLEEFKEELRIKRLARQTAVHDLRDEIATLRRQLAEEQELTRRIRRNNAIELSNTEVDATTTYTLHRVPTKAATTRATSTPTPTPTPTSTSTVYEEGAIGGVNTEPDSDDEDPQSRGRHANIELANAQLALQMANAENLSLRTELGVVQKQVVTLKEVITCCKQMLSVKEEQCTQLKSKLDEIETAFSEREMKIMSSNLRQEYERQLGNIRQLRQLYEERQRVALAEQENLQRLISIKRDELTAEQQKTKNIEEHNQTLMKEIENANNELATLREECNEHKFEKKALKEEMGAVNMLFSQMVMGFNGENNLDIDRLTMMLEENRGLLNDMATKEVNCTDGATLPKLLFELVEQAAISTSKIFEDKRSPTSISTSNDSSEGEAEGMDVVVNDEYYANHNRTDNAVDITVAIKQCLNLEEEQQQSNTPIEVDVYTTATDQNNANFECLKSAAHAVAVSATPLCGVRKHHRKNPVNRIKLPTATTAVIDNNASLTTEATTTLSTALKIHEPEVMSKVATTQEIIGNLPKVWKVLMELLSHHKIERVQFEEHGASEDCYKSIETANGTKAELSVSKTYIKLKDLILEKKSLVKETNRLKTLNCHLEYRLNEQEKRLSAVSLELTKTWHLVGKMQRQHRQLHTQEQILRYQLQQKRRLLSELKDELEYCRRKWAAARAKNDESQEQCNDLRREFALRKLEHANNSAESGYSDSGQVSDEEMGKDLAIGGIDTDSPKDGDGVVIGSGGKGCVGGVGGAAAACRRKRLKEMFQHTRKIKRMQSTSPGRAGNDTADIVLRWNSAPPTCGWRPERGRGVVDDIYSDDVEDNRANENECQGVTGEAVDLTGATASGRGGGAIPKSGNSGTFARHRSRKEVIKEQLLVADVDGVRGERADRIQRLEEQCKSLIQQVLETSDNREKLEVQLLSFQDEIAPVQYPVPLTDFIKTKRVERMTRASSVPVTGTLTPREEEYTRKRSERLGRLEEESRQLMSRIKRTSDRGHYLRCSLDRLRRAPSREGSFESNTEDDSSKAEEKPFRCATQLTLAECPLGVQEATDLNESNGHVAVESHETEHQNSTYMNTLTANEEAYTARRSARLQRLESESRELLNTLSRNNERGERLGNKLDALHEQHGDTTSKESTKEISTNTNLQLNTSQLTEPCVSIEKRLENIEQISSNRMERLRILEEEGNELLNRLAGTSARGTQMIERIAAREQNRQIIATTLNTSADKVTFTDTTNESSNVDGNDDHTNRRVCASAMEAASADVASLMPTLNNVACSSIVSEELTDRVTVTTTPSQIAAQQKRGAIPKLPLKKPVGLVLNATIRAEAANKKEPKQCVTENAGDESLEDMVKRLRETPFPEGQNIGSNVKEDVCSIKLDDQKEEKGEEKNIEEDQNKVDYSG